MTVNPDVISLPYMPMLKGLNAADVFEAVRQRGFTFVFDRVNWPELFPLRLATRVSAAHDGHNIYLYFDVDDVDVRATVDRDLGPVASDSCVEFFVSPLPSTGRYWNFEFNIIGRRNISTRVERPNPRRLNADELGRVLTFPSMGSAPFGQREGDCRWQLGVVIPLDLIGVVFEGRRIVMAGNMYKCAAGSASPHYLSCAPVASPRPDFHRPADFIPVVLEA